MTESLLASPAAIPSPLRPWYLVAAGAALAVLIAAILDGSLWFLNFVHVMTGTLWTGIDLFMGFVVGPVMRRVSLDTRRAMIAGIIPRTLVLMPTFPSWPRPPAGSWPCGSASSISAIPSSGG